MRKICVFFCIVIVDIIMLQAQESSLTIHVNPGKLKDAMTEEQMKTVTNLTLTGSLSDDDFSILRSGMPRLENLDMEDLEIETIPLKAFYKSRVSIIVLPGDLKCIEDSAFYDTWLMSIMFTGDFPVLANNVFDTGHTQYEVSSNNPNLKMIGGSVYSFNGNILYLSSRGIDRYCIEDGTKIINSHALEGCVIADDHIYIPASVNYIKNYAFSNLQRIHSTRSKELYDVCFFCKSLIPPILDENVFSKEYIGNCDLLVFEESVDLYKSASQWNQFYSIKGYSPRPPQNIKSDEKTLLLIENKEGVFKLNAEQSISLLELIDMEGKVFYIGKPFSDRCSFDLSGFANSLFILRVTYVNGTQEIKRIIK